jgi:hypothetical protein
MNAYLHEHNVGARLATKAGGGVSATAGGAGDNAEANGSWVDRARLGSAKLVLHYRATLAQAATLSLTANIQDAADDQGAGAADLGAVMSTRVVATGPTGGGTVRGTVELDYDLNSARQFVRAQFTPDLSAGATDTCQIEAIWVFGAKGLGTQSVI